MINKRCIMLFVTGIAVVVTGMVAVWAMRGGGAGGPEPSPMDVALDESAPEAGVEEADVESPEVDDDGEPGWDLPVTRNDRVDYWIDYLAGRNRDRTKLWLERSTKYGPMIQSKLRERGMPQDLIYLALIESGFSPQAYSRAHAVGIWQFIAGTGRRYGLEISTHVDERRDPIRSTDAALNYLEDLYEQFGSWYLAAAAYNTGENRVERILRQRAGGRKGDDDLYWRISPYIPRETRDYVPLMLAAGHIAKDPEQYGFDDLEYQDPLAWETVAVPGGTSLRVAARAAEVEAEEIRDLNPQLLSGITPPGRESTLRVPVGRGDRLAANLERMSAEERMAAAQHVVRRGETLTHIARRYGTTVSAIRSQNGWVNPRRLQVGQRLTVPTGSAAGAVAGNEASWHVHRVQRGDTLWGIARRYRVTVRQLQSWNGMGGRSKILPGQRLRIRA